MAKIFHMAKQVEEYDDEGESVMIVKNVYCHVDRIDHWKDLGFIAEGQAPIGKLGDDVKSTEEKKADRANSIEAAAEEAIMADAIAKKKAELLATKKAEAEAAGERSEVDEEKEAKLQAIKKASVKELIEIAKEMNVDIDGCKKKVDKQALLIATVEG